MRRLLLLGLSCTLFGSAIALGRQDPPLAEQQFKNIVSFKGAKASDVIPAMQFMDASLGVTCDYCHAADRSSDEKQPKKAAREMIAMQREINAKNFNGRNQVTCATCHAGHTHPVAVPPVTGLGDRMRRSQEVMPDQVLAAYAKAVGGDPAHPPAGIRFAGTSTTKGEKTSVEAAYLGEKFTFVTQGAKGEQKMGFNGSNVWFTRPGGVQSIPLAYAVSRVNERTIFMGADSLPKLTTPGGGTAKIDGKDVLVVAGVTADLTRVSMFFDKSTGLLARTAFSYPTILGNITQINDYSNYRKVDGVELPMTIVNHDTEGDTVLEFRSAKSDAKLLPAEFDPPAK